MRGYGASTVTAEEWERQRRRLTFGQRLAGVVVRVPRPGAIGIFVDVPVCVGGFVDVVLLPLDPARWPVEGTATDFEVWWADDRPQLRLKPVEARFVRDDFDRFLARMRPEWPRQLGRPLLET
ncbi:hypothetical protein J4H86_08920 [Spiractinospora alimapuensis]|uniref:hypothetical protein n=1 Tax=Spiractinospora alimapuensis TaxID=2820884 RepID=UPI001F1BEDAE|nr:hypothetical protein [Spiractinospora alimapuensis]QVQ53814.1 hypothetical protein J4H86_08920 [Spiractinospora alimapuensis]